MAILLYICCLYVFSYFFLVKSLQVAGKYCFDPLGGYHYNGADLVLWSSCKAPRRQFVFLDIDLGKVNAEFYSRVTPADVQSLLNRVDFKENKPTQNGTLDNMVSANDIDNNFGYSLAAYFIAPMSGYHIFTVSCDATCTVYFNHAPNTNRTNYRIIELKSWTSRFEFDKYPYQQNSKEIFLEVGEKYYLEGIFVAGTGGDHIEIGVYLPDGSSLLPITSHYLSADPV